MLVVVHDEQGKSFLELLLYLKTFRSCNIFQVNGSECGSNMLNGLYDLSGVLGGKNNGKSVNPRKLLEDHRLAFHNRKGGFCPYVTQSQHARTVRYNSNHIPFYGKGSCFLLVRCNVRGYRPYPGRVVNLKIVLGSQGSFTHNADLAPQFSVRSYGQFP